MAQTKPTSEAAKTTVSTKSTSHHRSHKLHAKKVALVGFGTVGSSVARLLLESEAPNLRLSMICNREISRKRQSWVPADVKWTENFGEVLNSDCEIVVELIGGVQAAKELVTGCLLAGKSVVTANKQLIAAHGPELMKLANESGQRLVYGASVAGGVPLLPGIQFGLSGDRLSRIKGILNGTCNYILSKIQQEQMHYADALRQAQELGYAEADPTDDVDGYDARAKLAILIMTAFRARVSAESIPARSIKAVKAIDFEYATELRSTIRQISRAEMNGDLLADVGPAVVPLSTPFGHVFGSQNVVVTTGSFGGDNVFTGAGAGGKPTAVAVVSDLVTLAQASSTLPAGGSDWLEPKVNGDCEAAHYVRFVVKDRPGIIASLATIFSKHDIGVDAVLQKPGHDREALPFVITLEPCVASKVERALAEMNGLDFMVEPALCLPILG